MKFLIYGSKTKAEKLEKILTRLYGPNEVKFLSSKPSTSSVNKYSDKGYKLFNFSYKKEIYKSYNDKVLNVYLDGSFGSAVYDIVDFVDVGVSEKAVIKALKEA